MSPDSAPRYRRRTRWPILVLLTLLFVAAIVIWTEALKPAPAEATGCNEPGALTTTSASTPRSSAGTTSPTGASSTASTAKTTTTGTTKSGRSTTISTTLGTFTADQTLAGVRPADPGQVPVRVLNASTVTGQAKTVTDELRAAGFAEVGQQENDPLYPAADLRCYGEIRYGYAGLAEARTVLIVAPCAQLVLDGRSDNSVDLSLGARYQVGPISQQVQQRLNNAKDAAAPPPVIEGQTVSVRSLPPIPPLPDRSGCPA